MSPASQRNVVCWCAYAHDCPGTVTTSLHTGAEWSQASAGKLFPTSVVGSLPRPEYIRELMLASRASADGSLSDGDEAVLRAAIKAGLAMQLQAGCDIVTDGELGRLSYIGTDSIRHCHDNHAAVPTAMLAISSRGRLHWFCFCRYHCRAGARIRD